ncbi:hypothetical protein quinque_014282 [Culex quinquefasciatus]
MCDIGSREFLQCEQCDPIPDVQQVQRISSFLVEVEQGEEVHGTVLPFFVWKIPRTADLSARSYFTLRLVRSGMEVVAGARIASPYLLQVNEALLGTSEYERDFNYSRVWDDADKLEQEIPTVSPEVSPIA